MAVDMGGKRPDAGSASGSCCRRQAEIRHAIEAALSIRAPERLLVKIYSYLPMILATAGHVRRAIASRGPAQLPFVAWSGAYQGGCDERSSGLSTGEMATAQFRGLSV